MFFSFFVKNHVYYIYMCIYSQVFPRKSLKFVVLHEITPAGTCPAGVDMRYQSRISMSLPQQKGITSPALTWTVLLQVTQ